MPSVRLVFTLALRDLRGGFRGLGVMLAALVVGVGAIAAVGTVSRGLVDGLAREGRAILGGDLSFSLVHREPDEAERAFVRALGPMSVSTTLRAMARPAAREGQTLAEVKAIDAVYPLSGDLVTEPALARTALFERRDGRFGAVAEEALAQRLGLAVGDRIRLGNGEVDLRAILRAEPDRLSGGLGFGPRLMLAREALAETGLAGPGSLVRHTMRVVVPDADDATLQAIAEDAPRRFPEAGFEIRTRRNASPQLGRNVERFASFLTLVGLTALVVGGVGVANAARAHVAGRRATIATLKALGGAGGLIAAVYLTQILLLAGAGVVLGLAFGMALPMLASIALADVLPIPLVTGFPVRELAVAAAFGMVVALGFTLLPLATAHDTPVQALYRDRAAPSRAWPRATYLLGVATTAAVLIGLALAISEDRRVTLIYLGAVAAAFLLLRLVAQGIALIARAVPRVRSPGLRMALANIHRPGALTPTIVLSLGLGLTLLVTITLIDTALRRQIVTGLPRTAPSFFFLDIPSRERDAFLDTVRREAPAGVLDTVPMLRGRIVSVKGVPAAEAPVSPQSAWVLQGDRGVTYAERLPENATLVTGAWWAPDYTGRPLVSMEARAAEGLGLGVGDRLAVNVLGRTIEVEIANTRSVRWESLGINFVMVFSPNTFRAAPHTHLATLSFPGGPDPVAEARLAGRVTDAFPGVSTIRVREALEAVNTLVGQLATAVRAASGITLVTALLVLAGALAASHHGRIYDSVILRALGATRTRVLAANGIEYLLLGLATAVFAVATGALAAWAVTRRVMDIPFVFDVTAALGAVGVALVVTIGFGLVGTWRALGHKPARVLRTL